MRLPFEEVLTDGDGDAVTANLAISIGNSPVSITSVPSADAPGTLVNEAGLPAGSNPGASASTNGTVTFSAPDGPATVTINGITITGVGQTIPGQGGVFTVTSFNAAGGTLSYNFTLTTPTHGVFATARTQAQYRESRQLRSQGLNMR